MIFPHSLSLLVRKMEVLFPAKQIQTIEFHQNMHTIVLLITVSYHIYCLSLNQLMTRAANTLI